MILCIDGFCECRSGHESRFALLGQFFGGQVAIGEVGVRESKLLDKFFFQFLRYGRGEERMTESCSWRELWELLWF